MDTANITARFTSIRLQEPFGEKKVEMPDRIFDADGDSLFDPVRYVEPADRVRIEFHLRRLKAIESGKGNGADYQETFVPVTLWERKFTKPRVEHFAPCKYNNDDLPDICFTVAEETKEGTRRSSFVLLQANAAQTQLPGPPTPRPKEENQPFHPPVPASPEGDTFGFWPRLSSGGCKFQPTALSGHWFFNPVGP